MRIEIAFDLSTLDTFALVFIGQTFITHLEANPAFVEPFVGALLEEFWRRTAARLGRKASPPAQAITFELSSPEATFAVGALRAIEGILIPPKTKPFHRPAPPPAYHGPAAEFLAVVRAAIQQALDAGSAPPAEPKKFYPANSVHGVN